MRMAQADPKDKMMSTNLLVGGISVGFECPDMFGLIADRQATMKWIGDDNLGPYRMHRMTSAEEMRKVFLR